MNDALRRVLNRLHYPLEVMQTCVGWYIACPLSLRHIEEMMHERGKYVDHTTIHPWALKMAPVLAAVFCRRQRPVGSSWRMDESYVLAGGQWKYLYRAVDRDGATVDFLLTAKRYQAATRRFLKRAFGQHGLPDRISVAKSGANTAAILSVQADTGASIELRRVKYLNKTIEQNHRAQAYCSTHAGIQILPLSRQDPRQYRDHVHAPKGQLDGFQSQVTSAAGQFYSLVA